MTPEPLDPAPIGSDEEQDLAHSTARKDGRQVVTLRSFARGAEFFVECEVYPVSGLHVDPLRPGPYRFGTEEEARLFMSEASQALTFLGCDVS